MNRIEQKITELYDELLKHDGYGRLEIDMKILKRNQKEIIIKCGREFRYVVDFHPEKFSKFK
jgi:hypothetical protein